MKNYNFVEYVNQQLCLDKCSKFKNEVQTTNDKITEGQ